MTFVSYCNDKGGTQFSTTKKRQLWSTHINNGRLQTVDRFHKLALICRPPHPHTHPRLPIPTHAHTHAYPYLPTNTHPTPHSSHQHLPIHTHTSFPFTIFSIFHFLLPTFLLPIFFFLACFRCLLTNGDDWMER